MPDEPDPPRKFYALGKTEFDRVNPPVENPGAAPPNQEVSAILRENLARAQAAGLNELVAQTARPSRRKRDYWFLFFLGNGLFAAALAYFGWRTMPGLFGLAGIIFFSAALTWVMWFVMDDY